MNILIRLPNWLGDMVMSAAFVQAVRECYPGADTDLIVKKGFEPLTAFFPAHNRHYVFSKEEYKGLTGARTFGKMIRKEKPYDLFFCLPDSLSSAVMAFYSGAAKRIGYKKEGRGIFLTAAYSKPKGLHRVEEYLALLDRFTGNTSGKVPVTLNRMGHERTDHVVININSEATSRRLPAEKAIRMINAVRRSCGNPLLLIGGPKDLAHVQAVYDSLDDKKDIRLLAGKAGLTELSGLLQSARVLLSTDSGPAHLANALGTPVVVLFGAGNENNTAPFNKDLCTVIRLGQLDCEPCVSNTCKKYGLPECLLRLDEQKIVSEVLKHTAVTP